jgi:hypothetical protein
MLVNRQFNIIRIFFLLVLVIFSQQACIKNDPTNISSEIAVQPEYSLPIGTPTVWMNEMVTSVDLGEPLDTTLQPITDSVNTFLYNNSYYKPSEHVFYYSITEPFSFITFKNQLDKIKSFMIRVNTINQIPAEIKLQVSFRDEYNNVIALLFSDSALTIPAATFDNRGNTIAPSQLMKVDNTFSKDEIAALTDVQNILITTQLTIHNPKGTFIRFYPTQNLWIQIGLRIKFDISLNDL